MSIWIKLALIAGFFAAAMGWHQYDKITSVRAAIKATEISMNAEYNEKLSKAKELAKEAERSLQKEKDAALERKTNEIKDINNKLDSALSSLQYYKECATSPGTNSNSKIRTACPGAELSREDAEFLIREAARAEKVLKERDYYYGNYEKARKRLESE